MQRISLVVTSAICSMLALTACDFGSGDAAPESLSTPESNRDELGTQLAMAAIIDGSAMAGCEPTDAPMSPSGVTVAALTALGTSINPADVLLATNLEDQSGTCWNTRNSSGTNQAGCGRYVGIGSWPFVLSEVGIARSGSKAIRITYAKNEEAGAAHVKVNNDTLNVRAYYYFETGFDFGQGMKIGRASSFNTGTQMNDIDIILSARSANGPGQCGMTNMQDLGVFYNGRPLGYDWGNVSANFSFQRNRWYAVEYQVILNTPGASNGSVKLWVDGVLLAQRAAMNIRGNLPATAKLNTVKIGGWYSNGAYSNTCPNPSAPSRLYMDDVVIAKSYIGVK